MTPPVLVAVAHGSRDPRSSRVMAAAVALVARSHPEWDVRLGFLEFNAPLAADVLSQLAAVGPRDVVLVPLLLGSGFHSRSDVPDIIATAAARHPELRVTRSDVLGARPERLVDALRQRVRAAGVDAADPGVGVAVVGAGSSRASGRAATEAAAEALAAATAWSALPCFASAAGPRPGEAVDELAARGCHTVVAAPWVLAPGKLTDKVAAALAERLARPEIRLAAPIGACPQLAATIADRFAAALPQGPPASTSTEAPAPAF